MTPRFSRACAALASLGALWPQAAHAHVAERGLIMLLPTEYYLAGGTAAVAASFLLLGLAPKHLPERLLRQWRMAAFALPRIEIVASLLSFALGAALVVIGFTGARDPLANPLPLMVWTLMWVGFTLLNAVIGDLWRAVNPWSGVLFLLRGEEPGEPTVRLPDWVGYAPAILGLLAFGWLELVHIAPDDPSILARTVAVYWIATLAAMLLFGEREWVKRGEFLSVFYGFIARFAILRLRRDGGRVSLVLSAPGAALADDAAPTLSGALFVLCALAIVSFDGLNKTFWWLAQIDVNPLEFPGRSAVVVENTFGLLAACALLALAFFACIVLGHYLAGRDGPDFRDSAGRLALSMIPISLAYHLSHYLTVMLVNGQYALAAASDPLGTGADWLGLGTFYVTTSFLNTPETVETIWQVQSGAIVIGHIIAVLIAHRIALSLWPTPRAAVRSQVPLAALMVAYTLFGLWLLASPTGA